MSECVGICGGCGYVCAMYACNVSKRGKRELEGTHVGGIDFHQLSTLAIAVSTLLFDTWSMYIFT